MNRPMIVRLARRAGVKSLSDDCYPQIKNIIMTRLEDVINNVLVINSERQTKTLMAEDVYEALKIMGENLATSDDLNIGKGE